MQLKPKGISFLKDQIGKSSLATLCDYPGDGDNRINVHPNGMLCFHPYPLRVEVNEFAMVPEHCISFT
jgi:hypothetical protein